MNDAGRKSKRVVLRRHFLQNQPKISRDSIATHTPPWHSDDGWHFSSGPPHDSPTMRTFQHCRDAQRGSMQRQDSPARHSMS
jgi:hypothetical protein